METSKNEPEWAFESKWPFKYAYGLGFTMIPNALLHYYKDLDMTSTEFLVLMNIELHRWNGKRLPFPRVDTLAERMGMTPRTVTRTITSLQKKNLISRQRRTRTSNTYSVVPLINQLEELAQADKSIAKKRQLGAVEAEIVNPDDPTHLSSKEYEANKTKFNKYPIYIDPDTIIYKESDDGIVTI